MPALIAALEDESESVRRTAAYALAGVGPDAKDAVGAVLRSVSRDGEGPRHLDIDMLARVMEGLGAGALPGLLDGLENPENRLAAEAARETTSTFAAMALGDIGPAAKSGVPAEIDALGHGSIFAKVSVAKALGKIGPDAQAAIPRLIAIHHELDNTERKSFARAIAAIDPTVDVHAEVSRADR